MKVHEASKAKKMSNKEFLAEYGEEFNLKSHMSKLPVELEAELFGEEKKIEEAVEEQTETVDSAEAVVVEVEPEPVVEIESKEECPVSLEELQGGINGLGGKYKHYKWKHLLDA